jgi:hypothetical protein
LYHFQSVHNFNFSAITEPPYIETGFVGLQYAIQEAFIDIVYKRTNKKYMDKIDALEKAKDTKRLV